MPRFILFGLSRTVKCSKRLQTTRRQKIYKVSHNNIEKVKSKCLFFS